MGNTESQNLQEPNKTKLTEIDESVNEESVLLNFELISNHATIVEQEKTLPAFEFIHNYYIEQTPSGFKRVSINYESEPESDQRHNLTSLVGRDREGIWIYIGECLKDTEMRDGRGFLVRLESKEKYYGYFHQGNMNGRGRLVTLNNVLEGDFYNDGLNGVGVETSYGKVVYKGSFRDSKYSGMGKSIYDDGSCYTGDFVAGHRQGYGEYWWRDGSSYQGHWIEGKFHGSGKYKDRRGAVYDGSWNSNKLDGHGEYIWQDGRKYRGSYQNGRKHGYGEFHWPDGKVWRGNWDNGKLDGQCEVIVRDELRKGEWEKGVFLRWCNT